MEFLYSTTQAEAGRRFEYWNDAICKHFIPSASRSTCRESFEGTLHGKSVGNLVVAEFRARQHVFDRTNQFIRQSPNDDFVAILVESGVGRMTQSTRELALQPGDIALYDAGRPFIHDLDVESMLLVRIPRKAMTSRLPGVESMMNITIARGRPISSVFAGMLREALSVRSDAPGVAQTRLANAFVDTLASALEMQLNSSDGESSAHYDLVYRRALNYMDAHLDDCEMTAASIAYGLNVSPRTLSRVFARHGIAPMQELWRRRLDRTFVLLSEGRVKMVTQAAYQCGFSDMSHFSRAFRKMFKAAPSSILGGIRNASEQKKL
ncbi:helix-turn-helix domain-containing protein [Paraburkholderia dilworthii]|uniref:helix-turn-helix domain-containing protein n=1 Tax=Paraburkholderia dilworthii TaxID=948106 RepID=UPI00048907A0|nr:helix-turn-helix domain-containing protein [Paraburkholderia dilworthii]